GLAEQPAVGALFTAVRLFDTLTGSPLRYGALPGVVLLVLAPFLQVLWLRAQLTAAPLYEHARAAAQVYKQACAVYFATAAYAALLFAASSVIARLGESLFAWSHNVRLQQSSGLVVATPLVLAALLHAPTLCDRAQLALARGERLNRELFWEVLHAVDLKLCAVRAIFALGTASLVLISFAPRMSTGTTPTAAVWLFLLAQLTAAGRTLLRATWLAWLAEQNQQPESAPPQPFAPAPAAPVDL
ncbi:MAG TPA: hypothetical protein VMF89_21020, partial [Polyangiales bacterium]|nr:hypothetical protein [Polyangiales bacterium]